MQPEVFAGQPALWRDATAKPTNPLDVRLPVRTSHEFSAIQPSAQRPSPIKLDEIIYGGAEPVPEGVISLAGFPASGSKIVNDNHLGHGIPFPARNVVAIKTTRKRHEFTVTVAILEPIHHSRDMRFVKNAPWPELLDSSLMNPQKFFWVLEPVGLLRSA
jgi:hypothetical protein